MICYPKELSLCSLDTDINTVLTLSGYQPVGFVTIGHVFTVLKRKQKHLTLFRILNMTDKEESNREEGQKAARRKGMERECRGLRSVWLRGCSHVGKF